MRYIFLVVFFSLLTACQTTQNTANHDGTSHKASAKNKSSAAEKDGAPSGPIPSFFQRVIPKHEPLSRYGNPDVYKVDGRTYKVMTSAKGYRERGTASWYGTKFHSKRTSSGEDYNMYALTAAHRTLPLPTYVRVKNLSNGRQAVVKVNDRGPFHSNRVIDLSYAAAAKLGLLPKGTAPVEIEALSSGSPGTGRPAHYYLQAGAFSSKQLAESLRGKVSKLTSSRVFVEKYRQRYIVKVGPLADKRSTDKLKNTLASRGVRGTFSVLL